MPSTYTQTTGVVKKFNHNATFFVYFLFIEGKLIKQ